MPQVVLDAPGQESAGSAELTPTLMPAAEATAEESVKVAYLDSCVAQAVAAPEGCPFRY
ncbi:hypothetical protein [Micromonospora kangleipakensis]|uniref:hypothetical protein n=1 Tax=Micromonospora kangleipakensis TaxID=1077942 RepID=UPI0013EF0518|nr:hypothetical protein [Micromonospora kangleipakensis]